MKLLIISVSITFSHLLLAQDNSKMVDSLFVRAFSTYPYSAKSDAFIQKKI